MLGVRTQAPQVTIMPEWPRWERALSVTHESPARAELGLDTAHPIVFSGHQPIVFHNGILAKFIAQHRAAQVCGAARVWIVADQDVVNPAQMRVPKGIGAALHSETIDLISPEGIPDGVPSASIPARMIYSQRDERIKDFVVQISAAQYRTPYEDHKSLHDDRSIAEQFANATINNACQRLRVSIPKLIFASELFTSDTLWGLVEQIIADPYACVKAYNAAVARYPEARVRPLEIGDMRIELPLWGLRTMQARVAITTENFHEFSREELAPRGLFMSLLVRAHLGELFIHGTGGWEYDKITQDWARDWLGIELSPMAMATATQRLDLGFEPEQIIDPARAIWEAHHARHNPSAVGDHEMQRKKEMCLKHIAEMQKHGEDPTAMYFKMHALLEEYRAFYAEKLAGFDERVRVARSMQRQLELAGDRTWPFVLFSDEQLAALRDAVVGAMQ